MRTWGWICNSSENSVPRLYQLTESRLLDFVCCVLFGSCLLVFLSCQLLWVSDRLCDVKYLCGHRGRHPPMWHKGKNEAIGKRYCRQTWERERERERLWRGRMTESAAVWESHGDFSQSAEQERVRLLGKCWDFLCMCVWDANRSLPTEGEAWDVGKIALTDRTGWWAHLSYIFQSHQTLQGSGCFQC